MLCECLLAVFGLIFLPFCSIAQQNTIKKTNADSLRGNFNRDNLLNVRNSDTLNLNNFNLNKKDSNSNKDSITKSAPIDSANYLPRTSSAIQSKVKYSAKDSIVYNEGEKVVDLYRDAKVFYEDLSNASDHITINLNKNTISSSGRMDSLGQLVGTPDFKQGGSNYKAVIITYNYVTRRGYLKEFKTKEGEGHIKGAEVLRDPENNLYTKGAHYTTCDAEHPHFMIEAQKVKIIPGKKVITGPANLIIEGLRTPIVVPFAILPLKRGQQSGIIIPRYGGSYGTTISRGFFLQDGGYYFGLGEKSDLTLLGSIWANTSWDAKARFNYANRYRFSGNLNLEYFNYKNGSKDDPGYSEETNYKILWGHRMDGKARPGTTFSADVNFMSSNYYTQTIASRPSNDRFSSQAQSSISYSKQFFRGKLNLNTNARVDQNLQSRDIGISFPNATLSVPSFTPFRSSKRATAEYWYENINMSYNGTFTNDFRGKDSMLFRNRTQSEWNAYIDSTFSYGFRHAIPLNTSFKLFKYYQLSVGFNYNETWAPNTIRKEYVDTGENKGVVTRKVSEWARWGAFNTGASLSTKWYGMLKFSKGKIAAIRHVADPSLGFSFTPDFSDDTWGYYRNYKVDSTGKTARYSIFERSYGGAPGMGKSGNITFGLNNRLEMKMRSGADTAKKEDKVTLLESFGFSGSYNTFADSMGLSNISLSARTLLLKIFSLNWFAAMDPYQNIIETNATGKRLYRVNKLYIENGGIGKITSSNLALSFGMNAETFKGNKERKEARNKEMSELGYTPFAIPWNMNLSYNLNYIANSQDLYGAKSDYTQTLTFSGSITPSKNWTFSYSSGWDFIQNKISRLGIDLRRDLHCWQFNFVWEPIAPGGSQYFTFQINVKSSVLSELKYPRQKYWFDDRKL